jgi:hypothetical protein
MNRPLPNLLRVRTRRGECKEVDPAPTQIAPKWVIALIWAFIIAGVFWVFQSLIGFVHLLVQ